MSPGSDPSLVEGTIIMVDLDAFGEEVKRRGWDEYRPNDATALVTEWIKGFASKHRAVVVWGLDEERGTEEAVLEAPFVEPEELREELEQLRKALNSMGIKVTIVAVKGYLLLKGARSRRDAYHSTPDRRRAKKLLERTKRRGGNRVVIR